VSEPRLRFAHFSKHKINHFMFCAYFQRVRVLFRQHARTFGRLYLAGSERHQLASRDHLRSAPVLATDAVDGQQNPTSSTSLSTRDLADSITTDGGESNSTVLVNVSIHRNATRPPTIRTRTRTRASTRSPTQTLFTRLQSSLPPDFLTTIRDTVPILDSVQDLQARIGLAHAAQARVQGAAVRVEELIRGASVFLRDAVCVVPPDPQATASSTHHSRSALGVDFCGA
jgi:hypothetical protein